MKIVHLARLAAALTVACALAQPAQARPAAPLEQMKAWIHSLAGGLEHHSRAEPSGANSRSHTRPRGHADPSKHARKSTHSRPTQPAPPRATPSRYVRSVSPDVFRVRGCHAGRRKAFGIVILDFGRLGYNGHSYGTLTFSGRFATNRAITRAMEVYARGYVRCLPARSRAHIVLARGTSNYSPHVPSTFEAGRRWARETVAFARFLRRTGLARRVRSAAADDVEPAWDRSFRRTRDFFRGYRAYRPGYLLYNYGSLDGGVGKIWSARQAWYVTGGMRYVRPIPEIYYRWMAEQWAELSRIVSSRFGRRLAFAGLMTQHREGCGICGYRPHEAHRALLSVLPAGDRRRLHRLPALTNIR